MRERIGPPQDSWRWYWLCVAAWTAMLGAWAAAADVLGLPDFVLRAGLIMAAGFGISYYLPFTAISRTASNLIAFALAVFFALLDLPSIWLPLLNEVGISLGATYRLLVAAFLWVMVWRSVAIRTRGDALETLVPVGSVLLLALVSDPGLVAVVGAGVALLGSVAVMALTHEETWARPPKRVRALLGQRHTRARSANSWPTVYVLALLAAAVASQGLRSFDITQLMGRELQIRLARVLANWMIRQPVRYVSHEPRLSLYGSAPSSGQPLFEVECNEPDNWRMTAYEHYDHGIWTRRSFRSVPAKRIADSLFQLPLVPGSGAGPSTKRLRMVVRARVPMAGALPSRFWPRWVRPSTDLYAHHFRVDAVGSVMITRYLRPGDSYELIAMLPEGDAPDLSPAARRRYLQLPEDLPRRIALLARQITVRWDEPAAKVSAIASYLRDNYEYDPYPPIPSWGWGDPTDYFLFVSRRGYCVQFASAMALMCRCLGFPARVVSGFLEGDLDQTRNTFLVRARDAHAWVEVYLPGEGWKSFDPTPPRPPSAGEVAAQVWDRLSGAATRKLLAAGRWVASHPSQTVLLVLGMVAVVLLWRYWLWLQLTQIAPKRAAPEEQIAHVYRQMLRWLAAAGIMPPPSATPLEVAAMLGDEWGSARDDARTIAAIYTRARFSPRPLTRREAAAAVRAARRLLDRWVRLRRAAARSA